MSILRCRLLGCLDTHNAGEAGVFKPEVVKLNLAELEPRDKRLDLIEGAATGTLAHLVDSGISKYTTRTGAAPEEVCVSGEAPRQGIIHHCADSSVEREMPSHC